MLYKGVPYFAIINIIMCVLIKSSLIHGEINEPIIRGDFSDDIVKVEQLLQENSNSPSRHKRSTSINEPIILRVFSDDIVKVEQLLQENSNSPSRHKRGIVLIDEDFDKLPDVRVRQSWSGENTVADATDALKESEKDFPTEEGSGSTLELVSTIKSSITPGELQITKDKPKLTSIFETTIDGSGDDTFTPTPTESEEITIKNDLFSMCSNFTCDAHEITILPGFAESLSEESTMILTCSSINFTNGDLLQWYKSNGSDSMRLGASIVKNQLQFAIPKVKLQDSGKYVCIKLSQQSCCHRYLDVTIYRKPNYKFHLLIVGLVTLVSLFICLLLGIHRRYKLKKFKKQSKTQIPLNEFLL